MNPGRELDALISMKVFHLEPIVVTLSADQSEAKDFSRGKQEPMYAGRPIPRYSTDIAAAWEIVEKTALFQKKPNRFPFYVQLWQSSNGNWIIGDFEDQLFILSEGSTAPHAICLAALKALENASK